MVGGSRFICRCPVGCDDGLRETTVFLSEGSLLSCSSCRQRMSQIDESR
jgi:hypothetical protein